MIASMPALAELYHQLLWPLLRATSFVAVAPVLGSRAVTPRARLMLALMLAVVLAAVLPEAPVVEVFGAAWWLTVLQQVVIGLAIGFVFLLAFEAVSLGAEAISATAGLSFAQLTDPVRGTQSGVLAGFMMLVAMLVFLAMDGHLRLVETLVASFTLMPVGPELPGSSALESWLRFSAIMFAGAARVALPVLTALLATNLALGMVSRAAPSLNLFAIGFPATLLLVLVAMWAWLPALSSPLAELFDLAAMAALP
jgi:flagellar biosynthetic protein FliR